MSLTTGITYLDDSLDILDHTNLSPTGETDAYLVRAKHFNPVVNQLNGVTEVASYSYYHENTSSAVTASSGGATASYLYQYFTVTSTSANNIVILPAPSTWVVGKSLTLVGSTAGYELRTSSPTSISLNGGTGTNAESAIAAGIVVTATLLSSTEWVAYKTSATGLVEAVEAAA